MLLAEIAARLKTEGKTLVDKLDELFLRHGCHGEGQINVQMPGEKGMDDMKALMARVRGNPPGCLGGLRVTRVRDYLNDTVRTPGAMPPLSASGVMPTPAWACEPLDGPRGDMVILDLEAEGNYVAVRPSGTEPKVKIYLFAYDPPAANADLEVAKAAQAARLQAMAADFRAFSGT
jgi:phosphoglucomutase/phosphomannomutase